MWDWLTQNKQWVFSGIGLTVLGLIWWVLKWFGSQSEPATSPANTVTQSPSLTQSPSITVSPTIHVTHPQPPQTPRQQPRPAIPRSQPNLICLGPETIRAHFFDNTREQYFYRSADEKGTFILIVCFRNEPKGVRAEYVRVNVLYRDKDGNEIGTGIPRASWLGEHMEIMDFHVGDSHCAVLVVLDRLERDLSNLMKERRSTIYGDVVETGVYPLRDDLKTIEVRLLSGDNLLMEPVCLSFSMIDGRPTATLI
jgi:hypothetical protein